MKLPYRWIWRNRIGYMIYPKEVGTKVFCFVLVRTFRLRMMGKHYAQQWGGFPLFRYENIDGYRHFRISRVQLSIMPKKK